MPHFALTNHLVATDFAPVAVAHGHLRTCRIGSDNVYVVGVVEILHKGFPYVISASNTTCPRSGCHIT